MKDNRLSRIKDSLDNIDESCELQNKLTRKLIRRTEALISQQELTNNILISIARSYSKEELNERLDNLIAMSEA